MTIYLTADAATLKLQGYEGRLTPEMDRWGRLLIAARFPEAGQPLYS